jgi:predicted nucleic acid-binding protein
VALGDRADPRAGAVRDVLVSEPGDLVIPAPITGEVDYMLRIRAGTAAARAFLADLASAAFLVEGMTVDEHGLALETGDRYPDLDVGLADLSIVVLAHRLKTNRVLTFDLRHFSALRPVAGGAFQLLPQP